MNFVIVIKRYILNPYILAVQKTSQEQTSLQRTILTSPFYTKPKVKQGLFFLSMIVIVYDNNYEGVVPSWEQLKNFDAVVYYGTLLLNPDDLDIYTIFLVWTPYLELIIILRILIQAAE